MHPQHLEIEATKTNQSIASCDTIRQQPCPIARCRFAAVSGLNVGKQSGTRVVTLVPLSNMRPASLGPMAHTALRRTRKRLARLVAVAGRAARGTAGLLSAALAASGRTAGRLAGTLARRAAGLAERALAPIRNRYLPERHYMRGPGPASLRVQAEQLNASETERRDG